MTASHIIHHEPLSLAEREEAFYREAGRGDDLFRLALAIMLVASLVLALDVLSVLITNA